jgi:hypothetical protein
VIPGFVLVGFVEENQELKYVVGLEVATNGLYVLTMQVSSTPKYLELSEG